MLYEGYNQPVTNPISDGFKKDFSPPISDECENDYLDVMSKKPTVDFVSSRIVNEENSIAIQGQKDENREDSEYDEGDSLLLCYDSFELLRCIRKYLRKHKNLRI